MNIDLRGIKDSIKSIKLKSKATNKNKLLKVKKLKMLGG